MLVDLEQVDKMGSVGLAVKQIVTGQLVFVEGAWMVLRIKFNKLCQYGNPILHTPQKNTTTTTKTPHKQTNKKAQKNKSKTKQNKQTKN